MTRVLLSLLVLAVFALCVYGMWHGWRARARRQAAVLPEFPAPPAEPGAAKLAATGVYVGTTVGDDWQDRVAVGDVGHRAEAVLKLTDSGVLVERTGASAMWLPLDAIEGARTARGLAGKVMAGDGLLVLRWRLADQTFDTGFRGDDKDVYEQWVQALGGKR
ncbi:PH-like domain-containing protein [Saccharothrix obliqua]|uniref:PH-like domain-containing protein n=1 Tax=Saccharothrix obliqua TaxID=2861747 RepID=UPI001C5D2504|nr:transporter [Saccharothrix obliqua]MBW4720980.1 transporter [Saccharothrix obliqua]